MRLRVQLPEKMGLWMEGWEAGGWGGGGGPTGSGLSLVAYTCNPELWREAVKDLTLTRDAARWTQVFLQLSHMHTTLAGRFRISLKGPHVKSLVPRFMLRENGRSCERRVYHGVFRPLGGVLAFFSSLSLPRLEWGQFGSIWSPAGDLKATCLFHHGPKLPKRWSQITLSLFTSWFPWGICDRDGKLWHTLLRLTSCRVNTVSIVQLKTFINGNS